MNLRLVTLSVFLLSIACISCGFSGNQTGKIKSYTIQRIESGDTIRSTYFNNEGKIESEHIYNHINWSSELYNFWVLPRTTAVNIPAIYNQQAIPPKFNYELPLQFKYDRSGTDPKTTVINKLGERIPYPIGEENVVISDEYCYTSDCLNLGNRSKDESVRNPSEYNYLSSWTELKSWKLKPNTRDSQNFKRTIGNSEMDFYLCLTYNAKDKLLRIETAKLDLVLEEYNELPTFKTPYIGICEEELMYPSKDHYITIDGRTFRLISRVYNRVYNIKYITEKKDFWYYDNGNIKEARYSVTDSINGKSTLSAEGIRKYDERGVLTYSEGKSYSQIDGKLSTLEKASMEYKEGLLTKRSFEFTYLQHNKTSSSERIYSYDKYKHLTEKKIIRDGKTDTPSGLKVVYEY